MRRSSAPVKAGEGDSSKGVGPAQILRLPGSHLPENRPGPPQITRKRIILWIHSLSRASVIPASISGAYRSMNPLITIKNARRLSSLVTIWAVPFLLSVETAVAHATAAMQPEQGEARSSRGGSPGLHKPQGAEGRGYRLRLPGAKPLGLSDGERRAHRVKRLATLCMHFGRSSRNS